MIDRSVDCMDVRRAVRRAVHRARLADKQAKPCLLACLLVLAGSKQASKRPYFGQSSKQKEGLLACLLVYCLYIVNLVVAVVANRPLVF